MNSGHRIGVLTALYTYWNWLKTTKIHLTLARDYKKAQKLYKQKRSEFLSRSILFHDKVVEWEAKAAQAGRYEDGIVKGIYEHKEQGKLQSSNDGTSV